MRLHQFAVSVSQVDALPHQLDAVYRHMLPLPSIRFLLADDPGAGKTIMAGLLMRELMQRQGIKRMLVLCPKALTDQWRREMWECFRQRFVLLRGESIGSAFGQNAWLEHDCVVASVDLAIQDHILLSAYRYGVAGKIDKTKRYPLAEKLADPIRRPQRADTAGALDRPGSGRQGHPAGRARRRVPDRRRAAPVRRRACDLILGPVSEGLN